jgi:hypothetical protein
MVNGARVNENTSVKDDLAGVRRWKVVSRGHAPSRARGRRDPRDACAVDSVTFAEDGSQRVIEYENDALTLKLEKVPLTDVVAEVAKQSGAQVQGDVLQPRDLTLQLDKVPLKEALERLLGEQNFALTTPRTAS